MVRKKVARAATESVSRAKGKSGAEEVKQRKGTVQLFDGEPAIVRVGLGATLNMGNYESMRVGVDIELPCTEKQVPATFNRARKFARKKLAELIAEYRSDDEMANELSDE